MKDAEDEAFDELAKRQGHWGGGYQAKKAMAADKLQEPVVFESFLESQDFYELMQTYRHCLTDALLPFEAVKDALRSAHIKALAQPAQEPVAWWNDMSGVIDLNVSGRGKPLYTAPSQPAQEPVAYVTGVYGGMFVVEPLNPAMVLPVGMALYAGPA
jgi:hypothetical protein